jgi:hypothetical protein
MTPLRQRVLEDVQVRNLSPLTQRAYLGHVSRFARHLDQSLSWAPRRFGPTNQIYLTNNKAVGLGFDHH